METTADLDGDAGTKDDEAKEPDHKTEKRKESKKKKKSESSDQPEVAESKAESSRDKKEKKRKSEAVADGTATTDVKAKKVIFQFARHCDQNYCGENFADVCCREYRRSLPMTSSTQKMLL